jgi:hypothetical protein
MRKFRLRSIRSSALFLCNEDLVIDDDLLQLISTTNVPKSNRLV